MRVGGDETSIPDKTDSRCVHRQMSYSSDPDHHQKGMQVFAFEPNWQIVTELRIGRMSSDSAVFNLNTIHKRECVTLKRTEALRFINS